MNNFTTFSSPINADRIDTLLSERYPEYSRSYFQKIINDGCVLINGQPAKPSAPVMSGDQIEIGFPSPKETARPEPEKIPLDIIYEDENVIVINKQPGLVVHPAAGNPSGTLINALMFHYPPIAKIAEKGQEFRPGLVHRLDKDTSGIILVTKTKRAQHSIARQILNRTVIKNYLALCAGWPKEDSGNIVSYIGRHHKNRKMMAEVGPHQGREAITDYFVKGYYQYNQNKRISLVEFSIKTGRTHQIRVHAKSIGIPVLGDAVYNTKESIGLSKELVVPRQMLHSASFTVYLPDEQKPRTFCAPLTCDFQEILSELTRISS